VRDRQAQRNSQKPASPHGAISLVEARSLVDAPRCRSGATPLMHAARNGHTPLVKLLLLYGADAQARNAKGQNALMLAARACVLERDRPQHYAFLKRPATPFVPGADDAAAAVGAAAAAAADAGKDGAGAAAAAAAGAAAGAAAPSVSSVIISAPTWTSSSTATDRLWTTPAVSERTSTDTLSVSITATISSTATASPTAFSTDATVPSVMLSPIAGTFRTCVASGRRAQPPPALRGAARARWTTRPRVRSMSSAFWFCLCFAVSAAIRARKVVSQKPSAPMRLWRQRQRTHNALTRRAPSAKAKAVKFS